MHIDYKGMLPKTKGCDHNHVTWAVDEPTNKPYVLVTVECKCKSCPAAVHGARVQKT